MKDDALRSPASMQPSGLAVLSGLLVILLAGCATPSQPATSTVTFVVVRHAEKVGDGSRDPPLTVAGIARARGLAAALHDEPVAAIYATPYLRTRQTAAPTATDHRLAVIPYPADQPAAVLAAQLRSRHNTGTVLVVGHSNTVPGIVAA